MAQAMLDSSPRFDPMLLTAELEPVDSFQLSIGNSTSLGSSNLLNCTVSTTIRDVRRGFFADGDDPNRKHEAAVVVFEFEFGSQQRRSWNPRNRISAAKIMISVYKEEVEFQDVREEVPEQGRDLAIVKRYPRAARSAGSETTDKKSVVLNLEPSPPGVSLGGLSVSRETESREIRAASVSSYVDGKMRIIWKLEEEGVSERGVPDLFACAVLLQTDGLPFALSVRFTAPILGNLYCGQTKMPIESKYLRERKGRASWESEWRDFDSDDFKEWVRRKTRNGWAETSEYSDD